MHTLKCHGSTLIEAPLYEGLRIAVLEHRLLIPIKLTFREVHVLIANRNYFLKLIGCIGLDSETTTRNAGRFPLLISLRFPKHFASSGYHC